jgi:hypothetical protein
LQLELKQEPAYGAVRIRATERPFLWRHRAVLLTSGEDDGHQVNQHAVKCSLTFVTFMKAKMTAIRQMTAEMRATVAVAQLCSCHALASSSVKDAVASQHSVL